MTAVRNRNCLYMSITINQTNEKELFFQLFHVVLFEVEVISPRQTNQLTTQQQVNYFK